MKHDRSSRRQAGLHASLCGAFLLGFLFLALGCSNPSHGHTVMDTIRDSDQGDAAQVADQEAGMLLAASRATTPVVALQTGSRFDSDTLVEARSQVLNVSNCRQCHVQPIAPSSPPKAHWDRNLVHANDLLNCLTCHNAEDQMGTLRTLNDRPVDFDHAYQICSQCHFQQAKDWQGGAHGKRLHGWAGTRIIRNCTGCHDPHQPGFPVRMPAFAPRPIEEPLSKTH